MATMSMIGDFAFWVEEGMFEFFFWKNKNKNKNREMSHLEDESTYITINKLHVLGEPAGQ